MAQATSKRRGQNEDSIFWDDAKSRYVGAVSLGYNPSGTRIRKKVMGRTKTEVRDKLILRPEPGGRNGRLHAYVPVL